MDKYNPFEVEKKWQKIWEEKKVFEAKDFDSKKFYQLEMFPYPSGKIHMGHVRNYTIGDVIARYKRMCGFSVLHPIGFDAFGLPAENAAIENNTHPATWTYSNIEYMTKQLKRLGFSFDWNRLLITCDPNYYKWEQKLFIEMFKKGMVYREKSKVNYCPVCNTVLANEQVEDNKCWRCGNIVVEKEFYSWFFKITDYAEQLLSDMESIKDGWPNKVLSQQTNWIGRSRGAFIKFFIDGSDEFLEVFTTRPDTLFGATFASIALDHPLLNRIVKDEKIKDKINELKVYETQTRKNYEKDKIGIFTDMFLINPANHKKIPLYAANFVLMEYGTGVVMGVPAHDQRDFEFAEKYQLPKRLVIFKHGESESVEKLTRAYEGNGILVKSKEFNGLENEIAKEKIVEALEKDGLARFSFQYKLRDWNISRQRYWGAPIPIIYCDRCGIVPEEELNLPVKLPEDVKITGKGGSPLSKLDSFINITCPICGGAAKRETDTFDTFVESSWYFLRYTSVQLQTSMLNKTVCEHWMPVDQYVGGVEHAVMHLLYARYFVKVLRDLGYLNFEEPFRRLLTQGMVIKDGAKMSKSKGNVVDPDDMINQYGADACRLFMLFAAPPEKDLEWSDEGIEGSYRFIKRMYKLVMSHKDLTVRVVDINTERLKNLNYAINNTVKKVTESIESFHFNTAIAALMEFVNFLQSFEPNSNEEGNLFGLAIKTLVELSSVFVPHVSEELYNEIGKDILVCQSKWPEFDERALVKDSIIIAVMINGKLRHTVVVNVDSDEENVFNEAMKSKKIQKYVGNKIIKKRVFIKNKVLNLVI